MRLITNRFPARCKQCKSLVAEGASVWWGRGFGVICDPCFAKPDQADADTWGVQDAIDATVDAEERARVNDLARRYGPSGKFNRAMAAAITDADPPVQCLGPDALAAEIDAVCAVLSDRYDGTPEEIFHRRERDVRRFDAYRRLLDTLAGEQRGRDRLAAEAAQQNAPAPAPAPAWATCQHCLVRPTLPERTHCGHRFCRESDDWGRHSVYEVALANGKTKAQAQALARAYVPGGEGR